MVSSPAIQVSAVQRNVESGWRAPTGYSDSEDTDDGKDERLFRSGPRRIEVPSSSESETSTSPPSKLARSTPSASSASTDGTTAGAGVDEEGNESDYVAPGVSFSRLARRYTLARSWLPGVHRALFATPDEAFGAPSTDTPMDMKQHNRSVARTQRPESRHIQATDGTGDRAAAERLEPLDAATAATLQLLQSSTSTELGEQRELHKAVELSRKSLIADTASMHATGQVSDAFRSRITEQTRAPSLLASETNVQVVSVAGTSPRTAVLRSLDQLLEERMRGLDIATAFMPMARVIGPLVFANGGGPERSAKRAACGVVYPSMKMWTPSKGTADRSELHLGLVRVADDAAIEASVHCEATSRYQTLGEALATGNRRHDFFQELVTRYRTQKDEHGEIVASLLDALYGDHAGAASPWYRFSAWLRDCACPKMQSVDEFRDDWQHARAVSAVSAASDGQALDEALFLLSGGQVLAAAQRLQKAGDLRLALLLSRCLDPHEDLALDAANQVETWENDGLSEKTLGARRLDLMYLLAGQVQRASGHALVSMDEPPWFCGPHLTWIRAFALFFWYARMDASRRDALQGSVDATAGAADTNDSSTDAYADDVRFRMRLSAALDAYETAWKAAMHLRSRSRDLDDDEEQDEHEDAEDAVRPSATRSPRSSPPAMHASSRSPSPIPRSPRSPRSQLRASSRSPSPMPRSPRSQLRASSRSPSPMPRSPRSQLRASSRSPRAVAAASLARVPPPLPPALDRAHRRGELRQLPLTADEAETGPEDRVTTLAVFDAVYVLLRWYCLSPTFCSRRYQLMPECFGLHKSDSLDFRLVWLLWECIGSGAWVSVPFDWIDPLLRAQCYEAYALQLESAGRPLEAIYVRATLSRGSDLLQYLCYLWPRLLRENVPDWPVSLPVAGELRGSGPSSEASWSTVRTAADIDSLPVMRWLRERVRLPRCWLLQAHYQWLEFALVAALSDLEHSGSLAAGIWDPRKLVYAAELGCALLQTGIAWLGASTAPLGRLRTGSFEAACEDAVTPNDAMDTELSHDNTDGSLSAFNHAARVVLGPRTRLMMQLHLWAAVRLAPLFLLQRGIAGSSAWSGAFASREHAMRLANDWRQMLEAFQALEAASSSHLTVPSPTQAHDLTFSDLGGLLLDLIAVREHLGMTLRADGVEVESPLDLPVATLYQRLQLVEEVRGSRFDTSWILRFCQRVLRFAETQSIPSCRGTPALSLLVYHIAAVAGRLLCFSLIHGDAWSVLEDPADRSAALTRIRGLLDALPLLEGDRHLLWSELEFADVASMRQNQRWILRDPLRALRF